MKNKFKVGDKVIPNEKTIGQYSITVKGKMLLGEVVEVYGNGKMKIKVLKHVDKYEIKETYVVDSERFDLSKSPIKEVKRRAKVGEWIKIVNPENAYGYYEKGDITKVVEIHDDGAWVYCGFGKDQMGGNGLCVHYDEYVVLEGYDDCKPTIVEHLVRGNKTIVKLSDGKVGVAKCNPEDTFDVYEGLTLALARAYGKEESPAVKEEKPEFKPHLERMTGGHLGVIGEPTNYKDAVGRPLVIGDVVECFNEDATSHGEAAIVKDGENVFVMGIRSSCDGKNTGIWKILKKRAFADVKDGEIVDKNVRYVKTEKGPYKITLSQFIANEGKKIAVNIKTEDEFCKFIEACKKKGYFEKFASYETVAVKIKEGNFCLGYNFVHKEGYANADFYKQEGATIYTFDEVDLNN